ncbi:MAG TPA: hypothetical protein VE591_04380 [Candidatus Acidoferrum sp.]|nr:hypothetical protein [Candidatus Acidoferrum sp.]
MESRHYGVVDDYECASTSSCVEIAHLIRGRMRVRLAKEVSFLSAFAWLTAQAGVTHVRGNEQCRSIAVWFDPERVSAGALIETLTARLDAPNASAESSAVFAAAMRVVPAVVLNLIDPPALSVLRDVVAAIRIVPAALHEVRVRPWYEVVLRALTRFVLECSLLDLLFPGPIRLVFRLGRAVLAIRAALGASLSPRRAALAARPRLAIAA